MISSILLFRRPDTNLILRSNSIQHSAETNPYSSASIIHLPVIQRTYPFDWRTPPLRLELGQSRQVKRMLLPVSAFIVGDSTSAVPKLRVG